MERNGTQQVQNVVGTISYLKGETRVVSDEEIRRDLEDYLTELNGPEGERTREILEESGKFVEGLRGMQRDYSSGKIFFRHKLEDWWDEGKSEAYHDLIKIVGGIGKLLYRPDRSVESCVGAIIPGGTLTIPPKEIKTWSKMAGGGFGGAVGIVGIDAMVKEAAIPIYAYVTMPLVAAGLFGMMCSLDTRKNAFSRTADEIERKVKYAKQNLEKLGI